MAAYQAVVVAELHRRQPLTKNDLSRVLGKDADECSNVLGKLWRDEVLIRRKRRNPSKKGKDPYEYMIAPAPSWNAVDDAE